jgi:hypothetical protein
LTRDRGDLHGREDHHRHGAVKMDDHHGVAMADTTKVNMVPATTITTGREPNNPTRMARIGRSRGKDMDMQVQNGLLAAVLGMGLVLAGAGAAIAHGHGQGMMMQQGQSPMMGQGQGMMMQPGTGMMGQGQGMMMGPHMMHRGMMGHGHGMMMGPGMMRHGKMGMMGQGMGPGDMGGFRKLLSADDVKARLEKWLAAHLGERVKVGAVEVRGDFSVGAEITTADGSLVWRLIVDRRNGMVWRAE